ncbi:MAG: hypothetical protein QM660_08750 [Dysgonomonas sp.]
MTSQCNILAGYEHGLVLKKIKDKIRILIESGVRGIMRFKVEQRKFQIEVKVELDNIVFFEYVTVYDRNGNIDENDTRILSSWCAGGFADLNFKLDRFNAISKIKQSNESLKTQLNKIGL